MKEVDSIATELGWAKKRRNFWTLETLTADAISSGAVSLSSWERCNAGAYTTALNKGFTAQIAKACGWRTNTKSKRLTGEWSKEALITFAKEQGVISARDFSSRFQGPASSAYKRGWMPEIAQACGFSWNARTDADMVYLWKTDATFNGLPVFKFGLTSRRRGEARIKEVAREAGFCFEVIAIAFVSREEAFLVEHKLKQLGVSPNYEGFNGSSEFRALTEAQLTEAMSAFE